MTAWQIAADADDLIISAVGGTAEMERRATLTACEATDPQSASRCAADRGILFDKSFASPRVDRRWCWGFIILSSHAQIERRAGRHSRQEGRSSRCRALSAVS